MSYKQGGTTVVNSTANIIIDDVNFDDLTTQTTAALGSVINGTVLESVNVLTFNNGSSLDSLKELLEPAYVQGQLIHTTINPYPFAFDIFGYSVAIHGNYMIVGAPGDYVSGDDDSGSAFIFDVTSGVKLHELFNPNSTPNDWFGNAVAISGKYAVVGVPYEAVVDTNTVTQLSAGLIYVYDVKTGVKLYDIPNPFPYQYDYFGISVAVTDSYILVGANQNPGPGVAYVYDAATGNKLWNLSNPSSDAGDNFGFTVSASGNLGVVGSPNDDTSGSNTGRAYVFDLSTGNLVHTINNPSPTEEDVFGYSVGISGNYAIVGAPFDDGGSALNAGTAYIYNIGVASGSIGAPIHTIYNATADDYFGYSVAISGNYAVIGAYSSNAGAIANGIAHVYNLSETSIEAVLNNPTPGVNDNFGWAVAISDNYVVVGAYNNNDNFSAASSGASYVYATKDLTHLDRLITMVED